LHQPSDLPRPAAGTHLLALNEPRHSAFPLTDALAHALAHASADALAHARAHAPADAPADALAHADALAFQKPHRAAPQQRSQPRCFRASAAGRVGLGGYFLIRLWCVFYNVWHV